MSWVDPSLLRIGAALTALVLLGLWSHARRRRLLAEFLGGRPAMMRLARSDLYRFGIRRAFLLALAGVALTVAAAEPRWEQAPEPEPEPPPLKRVVFAIDVSASMQAEDAAPTRLGAAVAAAGHILDTLAGHEVGLLLFAGKAYPMAPPTLDRGAIRFLLSGVTPRVASAQDPGTLLSVAISESVALLGWSFARAEVAPVSAPPGRTAEDIVVLFTDGDAGDRDDQVRAALARAREAGASVHVVAVGTAAGARMIMPSGTYQLGGRVVDARGRPVVSRLREALLREVAESGGGRYAHAAVPDELSTLRSALADPGPRRAPPAPQPAPSWTRRDVPFALGVAALALIVLESLLGMSVPRLRVSAAERAARARAARAWEAT